MVESLTDEFDLMEVALAAVKLAHRALGGSDEDREDIPQPSSAGRPPADATPDLATPDLATPDLATPDLATPDLATPDLATPDLATPDLATPDLATPDLAKQAAPEPAGRRAPARA